MVALLSFFFADLRMNITPGGAGMFKHSNSPRHCKVTAIRIELAPLFAIAATKLTKLAPINPPPR